ncbi:hypothetical protein GCM10010423_50580 [Streptomyces levis]|uniref:Lipoprotein n=1 Tax=Streptomyces levis TaxID=285566 RepID=A0ABP6B7N2_9ACTN
MANDADIKVNVDLLVESESRPKRIKKDFKSMGNHRDDMRKNWGRGDVTGAMDEFVNNWNDHRGSLLSHINTMRNLFKATIAAVKRPASPAIVLVTTGALLLTACGSGHEESTDKDKVADTSQSAGMPKRPAESSAAQSGDKPDGVDVSLPKDMNLVFDWSKSHNANEAAAMDDAANFLRAIYRGVDQRSTEDAAVTTYATGGGLHYAQVQIGEWMKGGWTATGTRRHYDATTRSVPNGKSVEVAFCADTSKFYGKEIKTGKVLKTEPRLKDFGYYKIVMVKSATAAGLWQASKVFVEAKAEQCR